MLPDVGFTSPATISRKVDFPHPLGPMIAKNSPSFIWRFMHERAIDPCPPPLFGNSFVMFSALTFIIFFSRLFSYSRYSLYILIYVTRKMILLAISGFLGGSVGYGIYIISLNLEYYLLYLRVGFPAIILTVILLLLAIGIPGAFISFGIYYF